MNPDRVENTTSKLYGKSDKANARGNQNAEFKPATPGECGRSLTIAKIIEEEHALRKKVNGDRQNGFAEWKRGFWAARSQMVAAGIRKRRIRPRLARVKGPGPRGTARETFPRRREARLGAAAGSNRLQNRELIRFQSHVFVIVAHRIFLLPPVIKEVPGDGSMFLEEEPGYQLPSGTKVEETVDAPVFERSQATGHVNVVRREPR